jgi:hypothetical protein
MSHVGDQKILPKMFTNVFSRRMLLFLSQRESIGEQFERFPVVLSFQI